MFITIKKPLNPCPFCQTPIEPGKGKAQLVFPKRKGRDILARVICPVCGAHGSNAIVQIVSPLGQRVQDLPLKGAVDHATYLWNQTKPEEVIPSLEVRQYTCPNIWCWNRRISVPGGVRCIRRERDIPAVECSRYMLRDKCWASFDKAMRREKAEAESGATT